MKNLQSLTTGEDFWDDHTEAQRILKRISDLQDGIEQWRDFYNEASYLSGMLKMAEDEGDEEIYADTLEELQSFIKKFNEYELLIFFYRSP